MNYSPLAHITLAMVNRLAVARRPLTLRCGRGQARSWAVLVDEAPVGDQDLARWTLTALQEAGLILWECLPRAGQDLAGLTTDGARLLGQWDAAVFTTTAAGVVRA